MYHSTNDIRTQKSADLIANALNEYVLKKNFTEITITDLQKASSVSRSTFYRLFDNIVDVLSYQCGKLVSGIIKHIVETSTANTQNIPLIIIQGIMDNEVLLDVLVKSEHMELLSKSHHNMLDILSSQSSFPQRIDTETIDYINSITTASLISIMSVWVLRGKKESAEEIYQKLKLCFDALSQLYD